MSVQVMCVVAANEPVKQDWLGRAVSLQALHRLTLGAQPLGIRDVFSDPELEVQSREVYSYADAGHVCACCQ